MNATKPKSVSSDQGSGDIRSALSRVLANNFVILFAGYVLTCLACYLYFILTGNGLRANYGDSWLYTELAKRIAFNHSLLHRDYVNCAIYPPLYPFLISFAYLFREQAAIFEAIKILNIMAYSSAFFPMYHLLKCYAGLSRNQSFAGAILLLINWCSLCYVVHIGSEPLYCPLLVWFAWFLVDNKYLKGKLDLLLFIFVFAAIPLTRSIGNLVFPCFAGAVIIKLINLRSNHLVMEFKKLVRRSIIVLMASAIIMLLYNLYLKSVLPKSPGDAFGGYIAILADPMWMQTLLKPSYWFDRTAYSFSWILIGTGTVAVPLLISIIIRNRQILREDALASFLCFFLAGTFVLVPLFTPSESLGWAFPRYYDPFLFLFIVILFKHIRLYDRKDLIIAMAITVVGILLAPPLTTHASCFALSQTHLWAVYFLLYGLGGLLFVAMLWVFHRYKQYFINLFLVMMAMSIPTLFVLDYLGGNKLGPNLFSFYDAHGITREVLAERASNPNTELIVDLSWRYRRGGLEICEYWEYWRILTNLPLIPVYKDLTTYLSDPLNKGKRFMVLTHQNIPNAVKIVKGQDISLYIFDRYLLR